MTPEGGDSPGLPFDVDIAIEDDNWNDVIDDPDPIVNRALTAALAVMERPKQGELSIALVDDAHIQRLNRDFRDRNKPTNVLSFPSVGPAPMLGDIVLARETVLREAEDRGIQPIDHITHLLIHGFLHLQGYDHMQEQDAREMESLEISGLQRLGIDNPYEIKEFSK